MYSNVTPIPPDTVLDTSTGALTGPGITESVLYSIDMKAIDEELQYKTQTFQVALLAGALNTVVSVHSMTNGVAALTDSGALYAWGPGFELDPSYPLPTLSSSGSMAGSLAGKSVLSVACQTHTMVIATDGTLHGFGLNQYGKLTGSNRVYRTPILINSGSLSGKSVSSVACGTVHTMVIATDGTLHGFGTNGNGQLGDGTYTSRTSPVLINGGSLSGKSVSSVACNTYHTMVIATDGTLHGFGYNGYGNLGDGTTTNRTSPVLSNAGSLSGKSVSSVACGPSHTMVIATDGTLHGFGFNGSGQLGDGAYTNRPSPVLINGGSLSGKSVSSVACGPSHTMVIATDGTLHGFGYNAFGQLGDGTTTTQRPSPVLSNAGSLSGKSVSSVACGLYHTMVIATDGTLHGFGYNHFGQLGDGTYTFRPSPVLINGGSLSGKSVSSVACCQ
jgi:alpha-tubulin suppressor-like RCC1 family protein